HGFCSRLIRQNFSLAGVDPNFTVINPDEAMLLRAEIVRQMFDETYQQDTGGEFQNFIDAYADGNDERLAHLVTAGFELICSLHQPRNWLRQAMEVLSESAARPLAESELGKQHLAAVRRALDRISSRCAAAIATLSSNGGLGSSIGRLKEYAAAAATWKEMLERRGYDALVQQYQQFDPPPRPRISTSLPGYARASDWMKSVQTLMREGEIAGLLHFSESEWRAGQSAILSHANVFRSLLGNFSARYTRAKARQRSLDFSDLERKALHLLQDGESSDPSEIARQCHRQFQYVCVDEYQDVNEIQDAILTLVSTECVAQEGHHLPNLFAVGDVKQSIYGFRLAEPQRFLDRMARFRTDGAIGQVIDLQENFRSRPPLLGAINRIFERLMTREAAEIDYRAGHRLNPSPTPKFPAGGLPGAPIELHVLPRIKPSEEDDPSDIEGVEFEAMLCAEQITKLVEAQTSVTDNGVLRPARFGDIVLLLRAMKFKAHAIAGVFRKRGIPVHYDGGSGFFDAREIRDCIALLNVLDNQHQDIPLAAYLRSPVARLASPEAAMARIRLEFPMPLPFHEAVVRYAAQRGDDLARQLNQLLAQLTAWRDLAGQRPLAELLWMIYEQTGYLAYVSGLDDGAQRAANLIYLHQRAREFGSFLKQGLHRFMSFLRRLSEEGDLSLPSISTGKENAVRIMSIHASKGQEFPIVILPDLGKRFNLSDAGRSILLDRQSGIGLQVVDPARRIRYPSLSWQLTSASLRRQALAEEMRLLYVAMTRAKEHLILIGTAGDSAVEDWADRWTGHEGPFPGDEILSAKCMLDWIGPAAAACGDSTLRAHAHDPAELQRWPSPRGRGNEPGVPKNLNDFQPLAAPPVVSTDAARVLARFDAIYPHEKYTRLEASTSPTALKSPTHSDPTQELPLPVYLSAERPATSAAEIGTATHLFLEHLNFSHPCDLVNVEAQLADLVKRRIMTESQAAAVDRPSIVWLAGNELGALLRSHHAHLRRELAFAAARATESPDPADSVMLRGRIDLLIPTDDGVIIVDYKTDRVTPETVHARAAEYNNQLVAYRDAIERVAARHVAAAYLVFLHPRILWRLGGNEGKIPQP
ncbi:MAG TPA: 3'-5' exonuclease, partial [Tepidisphaeraceae bacterium]|nr:3'-5' exonuclease [Tepidisphaeraceae bacterium]